jgi:hypothetical protein
MIRKFNRIRNESDVLTDIQILSASIGGRQYTESEIARMRSLKTELNAIRYPEPIIPFESLRNNRAEDVDRKTSEKIEEGFEFNEKIFSLSEGAQLNWTGLYLRRDLIQYPFAISTIDSQIYYLDDEISVKEFYIAYLTFVSQELEVGRQIRLSVLQATNQEELDAIRDSR